MPDKPKTASAEGNECLRSYRDMVLQWNRKIPLISRKSGAEALDRLIAESVRAAEMMPEQVRTIYDIGTGAGLPGIPFALLRPEARVVLVDRSSKKTLFLKEVRRSFGLERVEIRCQNFEPTMVKGERPLVVTSLAVGGQDGFARAIWPELLPGDGLLFFVAQGIVQGIAHDVSCETWRWEPLPGRERTGIAWFGR